MRTDVEQGDELLTARSKVFQGDRAYADNDLIAARGDYEQGMVGWRKVLDKNPLMSTDAAAGDDLVKMIKRYRHILNQLDETFPEKFILRDVLDAHERDPYSVPPKSLPQTQSQIQAEKSGQAADGGAAKTPSADGSK